MSELEIILKRDSVTNEYTKNYGTDENGVRWVSKEHCERLLESLQDELNDSEKDKAFYRCCALSGEIPQDGSEPSANP